MHSYLLQDWITLRGTDAVDRAQTDDGWLSLEDYRDYQVWFDVASVTCTAGNPTLFVQHAPIRDELLFHPFAETVTVSAAGLTVLSQMFDYAVHHGVAMPLSKWVRWHLTAPAATWSITFRVFISAGGVGSGTPPHHLRERLAD